MRFAAGWQLDQPFVGVSQFKEGPAYLLTVFYRPEPTPTPTVDPTRTGTPLDQLPLATFTGNGSYSTWIWGNGTRKDCDRYATGLELAPNNTCAQAATGFNVKLEELLEWNPSLKGVSPCALNDNIQYCVQRLQARAKNTTEYCIWHTFAMPGQTCGEFIDNWGVTVGQFASWNPTVGPNCTTFQTGRLLTWGS